METILRKDKRRELPTSWELTRIGNVVDTHGGSTPSTAKPEYWDDGGILWATPTDITSLNTKYISDTERKISQKAADETSLRLCEPGTLLMTSRATIGYPAIAEKPITTNQGFINIHCGNKVETLFLYYWIAQNRALLERFAQGSTFLELPKKAFRRFHIDLPPLAEQRKIAEILSTIDETIEKTDATIRETQQLKKGLMQKLFTEGIGHTRFKETKIGRIPEEWEVVRLAKVSEIRFSNVDKKSYPSEIPVHLCNYLDVYNNEYIDEKIDFMEATATTAEIEKFSLNKGDVIITKDSETADDIAVPSVVIEELNNVLCGYHLALLQPNAEKVDSIFLSKLLSSTPINNQFVRLAQGLTRFGLNVSSIQNAIIPLPSLDEQHQIAQILSEVDTKIETEKAFKAELEQLKTGLMQVLLTGKVRVKV